MEARDCNSTDGCFRYGQLTLEIVNGRHRGARHDMAGQQLALVGRHPDCDVVLSDPSVAPQHCLISRAGDQLIVRPVGGNVLLGSARLQLGETRLWPAHLPLQLGQITLVTSRAALLQSRAESGSDTGETVAGDGASSDAARTEAQSGSPALNVSKSTARRAWIVRGTFLGLCGVMTAWAVQAFQPADATDYNAVQSTKPASQISNTPSSVDPDEPTPSALPASASDVHTRLADNVKEILRLSGVIARTRDLGDGKVEVEAYFASAAAMARIVQSRAMRELHGLREVIAINLSEQTATHSEQPAATLTVQSVVTGADPYLVASDGSRYYPGARFPNGQRLVAIKGQNLIVEDAGHTRRVQGTGTAIGADAAH